ncbi:peptide ABC transporter permease, partial [Levilactobacillus suantsaiihabitans]
KAFKSQMMSMYFLADAAGQAVNAQIVKFYSSATEVPYFLTIGTVSIVFGIILLFFVKKICHLMDDDGAAA